MAAAPPDSSDSIASRRSTRSLAVFGGAAATTQAGLLWGLRHDLVGPLAVVASSVVFVALLVRLGRLNRDRRFAERATAQSARDLRLSEERTDALLRHAADVVVILSAVGTCAYVSPSSEWVLGVEPTTVVGRPLDALLGTAAPAVMVQLRSIAAMPGVVASVEADVTLPDGTVKVVEARLSNLMHDPAVNGMVLHVADVTERRHYERRLAHQAGHDTLTGLLNRSRLPEILRSTWDQAIGRSGSFAVLFADLDGFKAVNDVNGHEAGDLVLKVVADRLRNVIRTADVAVRFGGDEFVIVCPGADADEAAQVAGRIWQSICQPISIGPQRVAVSVGVSVGVAIGPLGYSGVEHLMRAADEAMYRAKNPVSRPVLLGTGQDPVIER